MVLRNKFYKEFKKSTGKISYLTGTGTGTPTHQADMSANSPPNPNRNPIKILFIDKKQEQK